MTTASTGIEQRFVLQSVSWQAYETLLGELGDQRVFATYDRGRLELMAPSRHHDRRSRRIGVLVAILADELNLPFEGGGSTTFRREDVEAGLEPDQCFYFQNLSAVQGKQQIDLSIDPPPDLAVEVEISQRLLNRLRIYRDLGVPELWRDDGRRLRVWIVGQDREYQEASASPTFPTVPLTELNRFLELSQTVDEMNWSRMVRQRLRELRIP